MRLQCYEGLDESKALYEWEYAKQMLYTQLLRDKLSDVLSDAKSLGEAADRLSKEEDVFFSERFLLPRPLLKAIQSERPTVLLIDEIDRADAEFEAFLLEVLSDFQVSIPEIGTIVARQRPVVFLTSNNTRELSEALKRRCLYLYIDYPSADEELRIVSSKVPNSRPGWPAMRWRLVQSPAAVGPAEESQCQRDVGLGARAGRVECQVARSGGVGNDADRAAEIRNRCRARQANVDATAAGR